MDCSTPGFPVHHQLLELAQSHVHQFGDAIQPSHPLSPPIPPALDLSQHLKITNMLNFLGGSVVKLLTSNVGSLAGKLKIPQAVGCSQ